MKAILFILLFAFAARADENVDPADSPYVPFGPHPEVMLSGLFVNPGTSFAGELGGALHFAPLPDHSFFIGPRASFLYSPSLARTDLNLGVETLLWVANIVGFGAGVDLKTDGYWRYEPIIALHSMHLGESGAIGGRFRFFYDTHYQIGFGLGLTLQWSGIPQIGG